MTDVLGGIDVADEVIRSIIQICSQDVPGVAAVSEESVLNGAFKMLRSTDFPKGIRITNGEDDRHKIVDVSIHVEYAVAIPGVAAQLQREVKEQVEKIAGVTVDEVNIHVDGVHASEETSSGPRVLSPPSGPGAVQDTGDAEDDVFPEETEES